MFLGDGRVERTRKRDMRGDGTNDHEKPGHKRISCASQFTIPDRTGTSPDLARTYTYTRSSQPNQGSRTPDFSYPLVFSTLCSSSSPSLSVSSTTLPSSQNTELCHPSLPLHAMITCWHRVQHMPNAALTSHSIHRRQHSPGTACTKFSIHPRLFVFPSFWWLLVDPWM